MNFLAHAFLSFNNPEIMVGNFIGDFVKGSNIHHLPAEIQKGVTLHRKIDSYTDKHETFKKSVFRISSEYGKYRFVIADMFYDHFLAKNWDKFHETELLNYTEEVYETLYSFSEYLPDDFIFALKYMKNGNWLYNYQHLEKIEQYLGGITRRSKYADALEKSIYDLKGDYTEFENDFNIFLPQVISYSKNEINIS
ncbi:MAG: ACP phosphodiesterase [Bacteroidota bacterium]